MSEEQNLIQEQITQTTTSLGKKIVEFEENLHETKRVAEEAMNKVKAAAQNLSPSHHIKLHPLPAVGLASLAGFLLIRWIRTPQHATSFKKRFSEEFNNELNTVKSMILGAVVKAVVRKVGEEVEKSIVNRVNKPQEASVHSVSL